VTDFIETATSNAEVHPGGISKPIEPANWGDIFLYVFATLAVYLVSGFGIALVYQELSLTVTVLSTLVNFVCFAGGVYLFGVRRGKLSWAGIGLIPPRRLLFSILAGLALAVIVNTARVMLVSVLILITGADLESMAFREQFFNVGLDTWPGVLLNFIGIGLLAPIAEELFFRGLIYDWFRQKTPIWMAVILSSLLFGLGHYDSWIMIVSTFIMGLALALAYEYSKSIWLAISIHMFTNAGSVLLMAALIWWEKAFPGMGSI
jgi:membrane protease YdiL (CAAX protease family)